MFRKNKQKNQNRGRQPVVQNRPTAVFSYYNSSRPSRPNDKQASQDTSQLPARHKKGFLHKTGGILLFTLGAALVVVSLVVAPQPKVVLLGDQNSQTFLQNSDVYQSTAQKIIAGSVFNRNKLTFDASAISDQMRQAFPELSAVSVSLPIVGWEPVVHVQAFSPSVVLIGSGSGDFVLDQDGRAFAPGGLRGSLDKLKVPVVRDQSGLQIKERQIALPSDQVKFITEVYRQLQAKEVKIAGITLPAGEGELEVQIQDKPYVVRFNLYGDAREGTGRYLATISYLESRKETPAEYIDVRVDGRVFYK